VEQFAGGQGRDQLVELGSGNLIPASRGVAGRDAGRPAPFALKFPDDYGNTELAGREPPSR